jgi:hypothetical protein
MYCFSGKYILRVRFIDLELWNLHGIYLKAIGLIPGSVLKVFERIHELIFIACAN